MKNFIKLLQLVEPAKKRGFRLRLSSGAGGYEADMWKDGAVLTEENHVVSHSLLTDSELEPVIGEVLDHLAGKVPTDGAHACLTVKDKLFQVTRKDDCLYVRTSDEIGELLSDSVMQEIENQMEEI